MHFNNVVLPIPLRPMRHVHDPVGTDMSTSHRMWRAPIELVEGFDIEHCVYAL